MKFSKDSGVRIILTGTPISTQNAYGQHGKIRYLKPNARLRKEEYQWQAKSQWRGKKLDYELFIIVDIFFQDKRVRDWDNWHKISMDALTDIVWVDDSQVQESLVIKNYDKENPRIEIEIFKYEQNNCLREVARDLYNRLIR